MKMPMMAGLVLTVLAVAGFGPTEVAAQVTVEVQLTGAVVDLMPQDEATDFPADVGRVFLWNRVTGAADSSVQHVWIHDGMEYPVDLEIGGSPWRTYSSKEIPPEWSGEWRVEVRDVDGNVLEAVDFMVGG